MPRTLVVGGWLLLAMQFLAPIQSVASLGADLYQPLLSFAASLAFGTVFGPVLLRRWGRFHSFIYAAVLMATFLGLLEVAQGFTPGRVPAPEDFLLNAVAAVLAALLAMPFQNRNRPRMEAG